VVAVCGVSFGPFIVAGQLPQVLLPFGSILGALNSLSAPFCLLLAPLLPCMS